MHTIHRALGCLFLVGALVNTSGACNAPQDVRAEIIEKYDPKTTIIAFDVHGVAVQFDWARLAKNGLGIVALGALAYWLGGARAATAYASIYGFFGAYLGAKTLYHYGRYGYKPAMEEHVFRGDIGPLFRPMFLYFAGMFKPVLGTPELMQKLHERGYKIVLASNICPQMLRDVQKICPVLRALTDGGYCSGFFCPGQQPQYATNPEYAKGWMPKSHPKYFEGLRSYVTQQWPEARQMIFIDDKAKNIKRAEATNKTGNQPEKNLQVTGVLFKTVAKLRDFFGLNKIL